MTITGAARAPRDKRNTRCTQTLEVKNVYSTTTVLKTANSSVASAQTSRPAGNAEMLGSRNTSRGARSLAPLKNEFL